MKLFGRTGGYYLFWCSALYLTIGMVDIFFFGSFLSPQIQVAWISALTLPFMIPPLGRWFNLDIDWDKKMFDKWLGKKDKDGNVVKFPELKSVPEVQPPAPKEEPVTTYYRLGITSNGRVSFQMGYSEITMNAGGINNMIAQLELFRDQILQYEDGGPDDDPDGGEPVPVPEQEQKAA